MNDSAWIQTHSGGKFHPLACRPEEIRIEDIAHALSNVCRFGGHCRKFYSVAQHSVLVSHLLLEDGGLALAGLLHDASEAYLGDMTKPVKDAPAMLPFRDAEDRLQAAIFAHFGIYPQAIDYDAVHDADMTLCCTEARDLMSPLHPDWQRWITHVALAEVIEPVRPDVARDMFMGRFAQLTQKRVTVPDAMDMDMDKALRRGDD